MTSQLFFFFLTVCFYAALLKHNLASCVVFVIIASLGPSSSSQFNISSLSLFLFRQLEDIEVVVADHVQKVLKTNFGASWEEIGDSHEMKDTYALSQMKSLDGKSAFLKTLEWDDQGNNCRK